MSMTHALRRALSRTRLGRAALTVAPMALLGIVFAIGGAPAAVAATIVVQVKDRNGQPVPNAVAWAVPVGAPLPAVVPAQPLVVEQRMMKFEPYVSIVQTGTLLRLPNRDRIEHHVKTLSGPQTLNTSCISASRPSRCVFLDRGTRCCNACCTIGWRRTSTPSIRRGSPRATAMARRSSSRYRRASMRSISRTRTSSWRHR